ncbi:HAD family phosphatase [Rothia sp. ZJ1223]|uniref:HAD family hydrolase n=1 Tax=Rothia sp. ZJ1223 TaxID=2811098 RepID=UPI00195E0C01|nr:HAD family phosphatase [Rothia sp. ZJ1223]MBM7052016.1 HAD family phosphatase [Rothia sp. ZJ1223]
MTTSQKPAAILFDHDGTLVDTEPLWARAKEDVAHAHGKQWSEQDTLDALGKPMQVTYDIMKANGVALSDEQIYDGLVSSILGQLDDTQIEFLPGVEKLLQDVHEAGIPAAIVTNATRHIAERTAAMAPEGLFRTIVTNDDVTNPKPDPEPYLLAAQRLGVEPSECIALEDSPSGVASAKAAGMKVIVLPGMQPVKEGEGNLHVSHGELTFKALLILNNS